MALEAALRDGAAQLGLELPAAALPGLRRYYELLVAGNERMNLTAITDEVEVAYKHFLDSLTCFLAAPFPQGSIVIDVGSGAGLPGLVLKLVRPDLQLVLLDALRKRTEFLQETAAALGLADVTVVHTRAEEAGQGRWREQGDVVVARAVAPLAVLAEYCLPLVRLGGLFVAMKGPGGAAELAEGAGAIRQLGGGRGQLTPVQLPAGMGERLLVTVAKEQRTPAALPRRPGLAAKRPLR